MGLEFGIKVVNMARDNDLCVCVVKPHGVSDKPLGQAVLQVKFTQTHDVTGNVVGGELKMLCFHQCVKQHRFWTRPTTK